MWVESDRRNAASRHSLRAAAEWLAVAVVFAAAGAWPTPDTNEAHYLTRARHAADPTWAVGDFFLESPEAHGLFAAALGPVAVGWSLDAAAWCGRIAGWLLLAGAFVHVARATLPGAWTRLLAAAILRHTTAAGEWVIGGCEAKVFAWAGVLWAAGEIAHDRWGTAWAGLGAATAVHAVVGGWGMVAAALAGCALGSRVRVGWLIAGVALAAIGVVPALMLTVGADASIRAEAARIYVAERLPHHLLPRTFADGMIARHLLAVLVWWLLEQQLPESPPRRRLHGLTLAALMISVSGCLVSLAEPVAPASAYAFLRFYWFRLADGLVPLSLAITAAAWLAGPGTALTAPTAVGPPPWTRWAVVALLALDIVHESRHWPVSGRDDMPARSDRHVQASAWRDTCAWIRDHTPADACFIVPRMAGSFVWRTGRPEVACWKNVPQGPQSLVDWRRRIIDCYSRDGSMNALEQHASALGAERLAAVADRYGASHAIVPVGETGLEAPRFTRLHANATYAVYGIHP
jgi:hypothetical protein